MLRKLLLTSVIMVATDPDSYSQVIIGVCTAFFFVWFTEYARPYADPMDHILQQIALCATALNLIIGMGLRSLDSEVSERSPEMIEQDRNAIGWILIVVNVAIMVVATWELVALRFPRLSLLKYAKSGDGVGGSVRATKQLVVNPAYEMVNLHEDALEQQEDSYMQVAGNLEGVSVAKLFLKK